MATVLITDDDMDHRELLMLALRKFGHEVVEADGPEAARARLAEGGIDAVLTDMRMPGETGVEFCRSVRHDPATDHVPIMVVSADVNEHRVTAAIEAGADDYLTKPFHRAELGTRLDNLLLRRRTGLLPTVTANAAMLAARNALHRPAVAATPALRRIA